MENMTNMEAAELATLIRIETRSQKLRLAALESEYADLYAHGEESTGRGRFVREEIKRCDRALMELAAGRLPR